jgi:acetyltransferase-like isoleucine patch superfamily enzyme
VTLEDTTWRRRIGRVLPHSIKRFLIKSYWSCKQLLQDWQEYSAELVGHIPSHALRIWWYRNVCQIQIGLHSSIHRHCRLYAPWRITIGDHCVINYGVLLDGRQGLKIGNNVSISEGTVFLTLGHDVDAPDFALKGGPVTIEDRVFIGSYARVLPGVSIGEGSVIGVGSVVAKDVKPFTVVAGVPARFVRDRNHDLTYELDFRKRFG